MKEYVPNYYKHFRCIADRCNHNCCIGWEIDIDSDTLELYRPIDDIFKFICEDEYGAHFSLTADRRCPFLDQSGLCNIIRKHGEDSICQICSDHPRFRNFYSGVVETGLGLCCEEAARIILSQNEPFAIQTHSKQEDGFFKLRNTVFDVIQDREFLFEERLENLFDMFDITIPDIDWENVFKSLEMLDPDWSEMIDGLDISPSIADNDIVFEQLFCYFIFRHLSDALDDGRFIERIKLAALCCKVINSICLKNNAEIADISRRFSSEIEYSDENIEALLQNL